MLRRSLFRLSVVLAGLGLVVLSMSASGQERAHRGRKYKAPPPTSRVEVTILRNDDGGPVQNAAVVFHLIGDKGNMELKTNDEGKAVIDVLPTNSKVLLQVIARGFQTYGGDYDLDKPEIAIEVKLKRPGQQYSIYRDHKETANADKSADKDKSADADKSATPDDTAKNKSAEAGKQADGKSDTSQHQ